MRSALVRRLLLCLSLSLGRRDTMPGQCVCLCVCVDMCVVHICAFEKEHGEGGGGIQRGKCKYKAKKEK